MYKDDLWYRDFSRDVEEHREDFTEKQLKKFQIAYLLRVGRRVRDFSDKCETCKGYQHTLTRLEEELQELPDSKAQRQYQAKMLKEMGEHFVQSHRIAPPGYYTRRWLTYGLIVGVVLGFIATVFVYGNLLYFPGGIAVGLVFGWLYGSSEDNRVKNEHRTV